MSYEPMKKLQVALQGEGVDPGPVDGIFGPKTRAAIQTWQARHDRRDPGPYPTPVMLRRLLGRLADQRYPELMAPWLAVLLAQKGLHERHDNARLWRWLRSDGASLGDPSRNPWCGDAVATALALSVPDVVLPSNPYLALNWGKFGRGVRFNNGIPVGAVVDFWRGKPDSIYGHVGFCMGETTTHVVVAGGNQRNAITDNALIAKERIRAVRWPLGVETYTTPRMMTANGKIISENEA